MPRLPDAETRASRYREKRRLKGRETPALQAPRSSTPLRWEPPQPRPHTLRSSSESPLPSPEDIAGWAHVRT